MTVPRPRPRPAAPLADLLVALDGAVPVVVQHDRGWHARVDLPLLGTACSTARRTTRVLLQAWEVPETEAGHDAVLVVSELVGNAVRHGGSRVTLDLELQGDRLVVGVADDADGLPRLPAAREQARTDQQAEGGRGLAIVRALAEDCGCEELPGGGKRVWARLVVAG